MRWRRVLPTLGLVALGCTTAPRAPSPSAAAGERPASDVTEIYWKLTELEGESAAPVSGRAEPHIQLSRNEARVVGSTGCNRVFGGYSLAADSIRFAQLGTTRMACVDPALSRQEQRFLAALQAAERFTVSGDVLTLYQGDRPAARFAAVRGR
jgi:heat shock protein HslJ